MEDHKKGFLLLLCLPVLCFAAIEWFMPLEWRIGALEGRLAEEEESHDYAASEITKKELTALRQEHGNGWMASLSRSAATCPPWAVCAFLILVTGVLPIGLLVWAYLAVREGVRIWSCPICKNPARFLRPCTICGCELPGVRKLMGFCLITLGILVVLALIVSLLLGANSFLDGLPKRDKRPPAHSSRGVCPDEANRLLGRVGCEQRIVPG